MPCIAFLCAAASCLFVPAGHDFFAAIDLRVLALLFCLMATIDGLRSAGLFSRCAHLLIEKTNGLRMLSFVLVALPFFASMLVTNDVALLAFVPLAIVSLSAAKATRYLPRVIVLQAIAANIGGMVTPMGNPQNLFLYTAFGIPLHDFFKTLLPFAAATLLALGLACFGLKGETAPLKRRSATSLRRKEGPRRTARFSCCALLPSCTSFPTRPFSRSRSSGCSPSTARRFGASTTAFWLRSSAFSCSRETSRPSLR